MIKNWLVTGDTHGRVLERLNHIGYSPDETALNKKIRGRSI